jgi:hypothetical protein
MSNLLDFLGELLDASIFRIEVVEVLGSFFLEFFALLEQTCDALFIGDTI